MPHLFLYPCDLVEVLFRDNAIGDFSCQVIIRIFLKPKEEGTKKYIVVSFSRLLSLLLWCILLCVNIIIVCLPYIARTLINKNSALIRFWKYDIRAYLEIGGSLG